jgi:hypothetical protein
MVELYKLVTALPQQAFQIVLALGIIYIIFNQKKNDEKQQKSINCLKDEVSKLGGEIQNDRNTFEERYKKANKDHYLMTLRLLIMSPKVPKQIRLEYYDKYSELGGNSFIDDFVRREILNNDNRERE